METLNDVVKQCITVLARGGTILYPTDTIWGLGCDATNFRAVEKIYQIKRRTESKSLIVLLDHFDKLTRYVENVPAITEDLLSSFDKPLTVIYSGAKNLARNVIAPDNTIAIRIVKEPFCNELVRTFGKPIVSTSANISNEPPALTFKQISEEVVKSVDYVVPLYHDRISQTKPSTIIRLLDSGEYRIIRE